MSMNKKKQQRINDLIDKTRMSTQSVNWWEKEIENTLSEIERWESSDGPKAEDELERLKNKLQLLIPRAQIEIQVINNLEKELDAIQKEIDEKAKSKNKKKGSRKKRI